MSTCPGCQQPLPALAIECPSCHQDLLPPAREVDENGWEHSALADLFMIIGSFLLSLQAMITGIGSLVMVYYVPFSRGDRFPDRLLVGLGWVIGFCMSVALLVVFQRVANLSRRSP